MSRQNVTRSVLQSCKLNPFILWFPSSQRSSNLRLELLYATKFGDRSSLKSYISEILYKMFSFDNNIKLAVYLVCILKSLCLPSTESSSPGLLGELKPSLKLNKTFSSYSGYKLQPPLFFLFTSHRCSTLDIKYHMVSISSRGIFGRSLSRKLCFARGKPEKLNGVHTAKPVVTDRTNNGVSE